MQNFLEFLRIKKSKYQWFCNIKKKRSYMMIIHQIQLYKNSRFLDHPHPWGGGAFESMLVVFP